MNLIINYTQYCDTIHFCEIDAVSLIDLNLLMTNTENSENKARAKYSRGFQSERSFGRRQLKSCFD